MKRSEFYYLELGRKLEQAWTDYEWQKSKIEHTVAEECTDDDRDAARHLVARGAQEARTGR